jgi:hypothetical protein
MTMAAGQCRGSILCMAVGLVVITMVQWWLVVLHAVAGLIIYV